MIVRKKFLGLSLGPWFKPWRGARGGRFAISQTFPKSSMPDGNRRLVTSPEFVAKLIHDHDADVFFSV